MATKLRFFDESALEAWLKGKPDDWARVIAWRAAMRAAPLTVEFVQADLADDAKQRLQLFLYRCLLISSAARNWPAEDMKAAARPALSARSAALSARSAALSALSAALSAARSAAGSAAGSAALSAEFAALSAARLAMWEAVSADARALARGATVGALAAAPLWPDRAPPEWYSQAWRALSSDPGVLGAGFRPWLDWYAGLAGLDGSAQPHDIFGPTLSRKIALQPDEWWNRHVPAVNDDVAGWLSNETDLKADIAAVAENIPQQTVGVYRFGWSDGALKPLPPDPASDADDAAVLLAEARRKAEEFLERSARTNIDPFIIRSVALALEAMPGDAPVNGLLLRSRTRAVEANAVIFAGSPEAPEDIQSRLIDLAGSLRDALTCYPKVREMEAESLALDLQSADAAGLVRHADAVLDAAREAPAEIIHPDSVAALAEIAKTPEEPGVLPQSPSALRRLADRLLATRNFLAAFARGAVAEALDKATAAGGKVKAHWDEVRPKIVEAAADGCEYVRTPAGAATVAGLAVALGAAINPLAAMGIVGYPVIRVYFDIALKHLRPGPPDPPPPNPSS